MLIWWYSVNVLVGDGGGVSKLGLILCWRNGLSCKTVIIFIDGIVFGLIQPSEPNQILLVLMYT